MADSFQISGEFSTRPLLGVASAIPSVIAPLNEVVQVTKKHLDDQTLTVDTPVPLSFGGLTEAHVVIVKVIGGKVTARFTSADGATQAVPVDTLFVLISLQEPITAIDFTREPSTEPIVSTFLGQRT